MATGEDAASGMSEGPGSGAAAGAQRGQSSRMLVKPSSKVVGDALRGKPGGSNPASNATGAKLSAEDVADVDQLIKASYQSYKQHVLPKGSAANLLKVQDGISEENSISSAASANHKGRAACKHEECQFDPAVLEDYMHLDDADAFVLEIVDKSIA